MLAARKWPPAGRSFRSSCRNQKRAHSKESSIASMQDARRWVFTTEGPQRFPVRNIHAGIDLRGGFVEPVRATATGKVTITGRQGAYGDIVEISHGNGIATRFCHLSEISVKRGQFVRIGEIIGKIGSTGLSTGPHLHYELSLIH